MSRLHRGGQALRLARARIIARAGGGPIHCGRCGGRVDPSPPYARPEGLSVGHIVAVVDGGSDRDSNLRAEHLRCNVAAGPRPRFDQWIHDRAELASIATPIEIE